MIKVIFKKGKEKKETGLKEILKTFKTTFLFLFIFSFFINVLMLLPAIYMLAVYDIVVPSRSVPTLGFITAIVLFLFGILAILQIIRTKILQIVGIKVDERIRETVFSGLFLKAVTEPSKASNQPIHDINQVRQFLTSQQMFAFLDLPWVPIYIFVLFIFHPYYGYASIVAMILIISVTVINEILTHKDLKESNEALVKSNVFLSHALNNAEFVRALGIEKNIYKKWLKFYKEHIEAFIKSSDKTSFWSNLARTLRLIAQSLMLGLGAYLAINQEISLGMIIAGSILLSRILAPVDTLMGGWRLVINSFLAYKRLDSLLKEIPEEKEKQVKLPEPKGDIFVDQVVVAPPGSKDAVLKNVTLRILPGEMVAVVGPSGSGKTTLIKTILGIWEPLHGKVSIDGADLSQWDREILGRYIGYLPQDIELFEGTVAENIARMGDVDSKKVLEAAQLAGAHEMIVSLPDGYDTYIGPGGITLSGGQRQRIALARAVYGNPKIVILDEPDSNLDDAGERALQNLLSELKKRKVTTILITHKMRYLGMVDKIAVMQKGTIVMYGKAEAVLQKLLGVSKK